MNTDPITNNSSILLAILSRWAPRDNHQLAAIEDLIPCDTVAICNDGEVKIYSYLVSRRSNIKEFPIRMDVPVTTARAFFDYVQYGLFPPGLLQLFSKYTYDDDLYNLAVKYDVPMLARTLRYKDLKGFNPGLDELIQQYETGSSEYMFVPDEHLVNEIVRKFSHYAFTKIDDPDQLLLTIENNHPIEILVSIPAEVKRMVNEYLKNRK